MGTGYRPDGKVRQPITLGKGPDHLPIFDFDQPRIRSRYPEGPRSVLGGVIKENQLRIREAG